MNHINRRVRRSLLALFVIVLGLPAFFPTIAQPTPETIGCPTVAVTTVFASVTGYMMPAASAPVDTKIRSWIPGAKSLAVLLRRLQDSILPCASMARTRSIPQASRACGMGNPHCSRSTAWS